MNKLLKGALACAAGGALLLGGTGTYALWGDSADISTAATITSGRLEFASLPTGTWRVNGGVVSPAANIDSMKFVPGDVITYSVDDVTYYASGNNLRAMLTFAVTGIPAPSLPFVAAMSPTMTINGTTTLGGAAVIDVVAEDDNSTPIELGDVVVSMTFASNNQSLEQGQSFNFSGLQLLLNQYRPALALQSPSATSPV